MRRSVLIQSSASDSIYFFDFLRLDLVVWRPYFLGHHVDPIRLAVLKFGKEISKIKAAVNSSVPISMLFRSNHVGLRKD